MCEPNRKRSFTKEKSITKGNSSESYINHICNLYGDSFCVRTNDYCRGTAEFYSALEQRGFNRQRTREGRYVLGLRLLDEQL